MPESVLEITLVPAPAVEVQPPAPSVVLEIMEVGARGPAGPTGPSGGTAFVHQQTVAAATWIITHNLGRLPAVVLVLQGTPQYTDVQYVSPNQITVTWPTPTVGEAHLI